MMNNGSSNIQKNTYSILDAARIFGEIETAQSLQTNFLSLYLGKSEELLSSVAPYLFLFQPKSEFGHWLLEKGWGNSWGMFVETDVTIEELRNHFRKFLLVKTEDNKELYFRFYDPRVLRIFLPTCDAKQLHDFFGPISKISMESDDAEKAVVFSIEGNELKNKIITKTEFWESLNSGENTSAFLVDKKIINEVDVNNNNSENDESPKKDEQAGKRRNFFIE